MPRYSPRIQFRIGTHQGSDGAGKRTILMIAVIRIVITLQLDADRIVVTGRDTPESGLSCVPGTLAKRHKLNQSAITPNQDVRAYSRFTNAGKIRMLIRIEPVGEQLLNVRSAKFAGRQADAMQHNKRWFSTIGPGVLIG